MQNRKYDVIIIGSGIGGLCAGALLVHHGYKVLVVEGLDRIGGRVSTEEIEGFKLPTGAVIFHRGGVIDEIFTQVGAKVELTPLTHSFYRIEGKCYELPPRGGLPALMSILDKLEVGRLRMTGRIVKEVASQKVIGAFKKLRSEQVELGSMTFRDWLLQYTDSELVYQVFDNLCINAIVARAHELPASEFFGFFATMGGLREMSVATKGNLPVMEALAKIIRNNGDVWTNCPATKILVKGKKAKGVVIQKSGVEVEVQSQVVISNTGPRKTVELAGSENFDEGYLGTMRVRLRPTPVILTLIASDIPLMKENGPMLTVGARRLLSATPLSTICPELAPPGQHLLYLISGPRDSILHMEVEDEIQKTIQDVKDIFPQFEQHGRILKIDPRDIDDELPEARTWPGYTVPPETPVMNLFNVSDASAPRGWAGTSAPAVCAKIVVEKVIKNIKRS